jgi:O-antigen ligase
MSIRFLLFIGSFIICTAGALYEPLLGVIGYMGDYCIGPERQWWLGPLRGVDLRYAYMLALATAIGMALNWRKLQFGKFLTRYEILLLFFLLFIWFSDFATAGTIGRYATTDRPPMKMLKVFIFVFMLSHLATDVKKIKTIFWTLVICSLLLGMQAYEVPRHAFQEGRLNTVGGADFSDSNRFGGFMASMLFIIAVQFLRSGWKGKVLAFLAGGFTANAVVLTRSRGALLAIGAGMFTAFLLAPRKYKMKIGLGIVLAAMGVLYLSDPQALHRASTITTNESEMDSSSETRIEIWVGGAKMLFAHPIFGVGPGNFYQNIGNYAPNHPWRDAHNTLVRCAGELGMIGLLLLCSILLTAAWILLKCIREASTLQTDTHEDLLWLSYGGLTCMAAMLTYGMTGTLIYTEYLWWVLAIPACMQRVFDNVRVHSEVQEAENADMEDSGHRVVSAQM